MRRLRCRFRILRWNIFAKTKHFAKLFSPLHMGPRLNRLSKINGRKSSDTVPLKYISVAYWLNFINIGKSSFEKLPRSKQWTEFQREILSDTIHSTKTRKFFFLLERTQTVDILHFFGPSPMELRKR